MMEMRITPDLKVGNPEIDAEHEALCALMNEVAAKVEAGEDTEQVAAVCQQLRAALRKHFDSEHLIMSAVGYPGADRHDHNHDQELADVQRRLDLYTVGELSGSALVHYLFMRFANHVRFEDRKLGEFIAAQTKGGLQPKADAKPSGSGGSGTEESRVGTDAGDHLVW